MNSFFLRKALVLPAALTLTLGGILLAAAPAQASDFWVTSPTTDQVVGTSTPSDTVDITGQGLAADDTIAVTYYNSDDAPETAVVTDLTGAGGDTWSATVSFPDLSEGQTYVTGEVSEMDGENLGPSSSISFFFETAPFPRTPAVTTGASALLSTATTTGIPVQATGFEPYQSLSIGVTGPKGAVTLSGGQATAQADEDGSYTGVATLPGSAVGGTYTVTVTGTGEPAAQPRGQAPTVTATSTIFILGDIVITSPTNNQKVAGGSVTFRGTGTPGASMAVIGGLTSVIGGELPEQVKQSAGKSIDTAARVSARDTDPFVESAIVVVAANGTWSVPVKLAPGNYTFEAVSAKLGSDDEDFTDINGNPVQVSSATPTEFVLTAAAAAVTPPTTTSTGTTTTASTTPATTLAYTGSTPLPFTIAAGLLLLIGSGLVLVARRRTKRAI